MPLPAALGTHSQASGFRFFRVFLAWAAGLVLLYCVLLTIVDPRRHFGGHWFPQIVPVPVTEKLPRFTAYQQKTPVTGLILGSSRSMVLPPDVLDSITGLRFFNAGILGGLPDDYLAIFRLLVERGARPQALFIGLDDVSLNDFQSASDETISNYDMARQINLASNGRLGFLLHEIDLYHESLSPDVVMDMVRSVRLRFSPVEPVNSYLPDGAMLYPKADRQIRAGTFDRKAEFQRTASYVGTLRKIKKFSPQRVNYLETLLKEARSRNIKVWMFVTPYHPELLSAIRRDSLAWEHHCEAVAYYRSLETRFGVRLMDYTEESSFGGTPEDWYDGVHYNRNNAIRLIRQSLQDGI